MAESFWIFHRGSIYDELVFHAFAKLMRPKGVNEHLAERLARSRLPDAPLVSVILEDVPADCDGIPSLYPRGQGVMIDFICFMWRLYICSRNL